MRTPHRLLRRNTAATACSVYLTPHDAEDAVDKVVADIIQHDGVAAFVAAMRAHPSVPEVQRHVCSAFYHLLVGLLEDEDDSMNDTDHETAVVRKEQAKRVAEMATREGVAELIADALVNHTDEEV